MKETNNLMIFEQTQDRQNQELNAFLTKIEAIKKTSLYPMPDRGFQEIESGGGLFNSQDEWIPLSRLMYNPKDAVQILQRDTNSPFGGRNLIINTIREQNTRLTDMTRNAWKNAQYTNTQIDKMRQINSAHFYSVIDGMATNASDAKINSVLTYGSGSGGLTSVSETLHQQYIELNEGIEVDDNYDTSALVNISDLGKIIKRANKQDLSLNMRLLGHKRALVHGVYINGYQKDKTNKSPKQLNEFATDLEILKSLKEQYGGIIPSDILSKIPSVNLLKTLALTPGPVEAFCRNVVTYKPLLLEHLEREYGIPVMSYGQILQFYRNNSRQINLNYLKD